MLQKTKWGGIYNPKWKDIINWFVNGLAQVIAPFVSQGISLFLSLSLVCLL
jgi:hypothetical protein